MVQLGIGDKCKCERLGSEDFKIIGSKNFGSSKEFLLRSVVTGVEEWIYAAHCSAGVALQMLNASVRNSIRKKEVDKILSRVRR